MMIHNQQLFSSIFSATPFIFIIKLRKALHLAVTTLGSDPNVCRHYGSSHSFKKLRRTVIINFQREFGTKTMQYSITSSFAIPSLLFFLCDKC